MLLKSSVLVIAGLPFLQIAFAQTSTLDIFPADPSLVENLQGEVLGTGAKGTTYAVSGVVSGILATETLVKGATYLSEVAVASTDGVKVEIQRECGLDTQNVGLCTVVGKGDINGVGTTITSVIPATITYAPVAIDVSSNSDATLPRFAVVAVAAPVLGYIATLW